MGRRGFTLVEILVVCGLIGLAVSFFLPALAVFKEHLGLEGSAIQLASDLRKTQIEALAGNETRSLVYGGRQFSFSRTGNPPPGGSGTSLVNSRRFSRKVIVSSAGRIRVE